MGIVAQEFTVLLLHLESEGLKLENSEHQGFMHLLGVSLCREIMTSTPPQSSQKHSDSIPVTMLLRITRLKDFQQSEVKYGMLVLH